MSVFKRWQRPASGAAKEHFVISHFDAYQDGALAETETAVYKQHLKTCSECREWVQQQKNFATQLEMERAPVAVLAPAAAARIQQNLYQSMRRTVIMNNVRTSVAAVGALAVLALVVGAVAWWQSSGFGTGVEAPAFGQGAPLTLENPSELDSRVIEAVGVGDVDALAAALEKGADPNAESSPGRPALYLAARRGNAEAVRLLIDAGADLEAETAESSILAGAAFEGHREVVEILLNAGTDINTTGAAFGRGGSALYSAVVNLQPEVAKLLIERGADVNQPDLEFGETPLIPAAARNLPEIVALLLENGADIDHQDNLGRTALHYAAFSKYGGISSPETAQVLIDYGAALDIKDAEGLTPLDIALPDVAELLREAGAQGSTDEAAQENPASDAAVTEEYVVSVEEDLVGEWTALRGPQELTLVFRSTGSFQGSFGFSAPRGTYHFDGEQLVLDSPECLTWVISEEAQESGSNYGGEQVFNECTASYTAYATNEDDSNNIVTLRFELIEDPDTYRERGMPGTWKRALD